MLECVLYHLGKCTFNANEVVVGSNYETSTTLKKGSVKFSETLVRIYETICLHIPKVRNLDNCMLRH